MIKTKIVSSLVKAFPNDKIERFTPLKKISVLKGERLSFQLLHTYEYGEDKELVYRNKVISYMTVESELKEFSTVRQVSYVPVPRPSLERPVNDSEYISKGPGLYPDVLTPLSPEGELSSAPFLLNSLWFEIDIPKDIEPKQYTFTVSLDSKDEGRYSKTLEIEIINATLPENELYFTQWFHADCLASYYNVETWSERHWEIIENFARTAVKNGINMLLTPVFTPPLDTAIGGERPTTQLIGVTKTKEVYSFDFTLLDRWIDMCDRIGIKYFEISHFFTQWGAKHTPKVMATVDGEYKRIFGWETEAVSKEYSSFLKAFIKEFLAHMKKRGDDKRCFFHVSDEPHEGDIENYKAAKAIVSDLLSDYVIMDALSKYKFYKEKVLETPIPSTAFVHDFIDNNVPNLWTYYCGSHQEFLSNRFLNLTSYRNRSIGFQMFKYNIIGFLHWGYNFYFSQYSKSDINPYLTLDGNGWVPAGDTFSVYPARDGTALESIRIVVFTEALQDISAMKLAASFVGKEKIDKLIDDTIGANVTFKTCARCEADMLALREKVNEIIKENV